MDDTKGRTVKSHCYLVDDNLVYCELKKDQYCVRKRNNGKTSWVSLDPQPATENIVVFTKYYATLKADPNFQKHVTFVYRAADDSLSNVALYEYQGKQPKVTNFVRTNPKTVDKIKINLSQKKTKEIYTELRRDDSLNCARDFRVISNMK